MSNELATLNDLFTGEDAGNLVPAESVEQSKELDKFSQGTAFLKRIQLYSKGKSNSDGVLIDMGNFGIPKSAEEIMSLGKEIDVIPFARRAKAVDLSDTDNIIVTYDTASDEFKRIVNLADTTKDSGCVYGPTYLVYERTTGEFYEYFCNNKSSRIASSDINPFLPVSQAQIDANLSDEKNPRGPMPLHMKAKYVKKGRYEWFVPEISKAMTPFKKVPNREEIKTALDIFQKSEESKVEVVDDKSDKKGRRR